MPTIAVVDLEHVTVDGTPAGSVTDILHNYAAVDEIRSTLLAALVAWRKQIEANQAAAVDTLNAAHTAALAARDAEHAAALAARDADHATALKARDDQHAAALKVVKDQLAKAAGTIHDHEATIAALGGTELGRKMAKEKRRAKLMAAKAKADAALAALDAHGEGTPHAQ